MSVSASTFFAPPTDRLERRSSARRRALDEPSWSPADRSAWREVVADRARLREQLEIVGELSNRMIDANDSKQAQIAALQGQLRAKDALIADLEEENGQLIARLSQRETRIQRLEALLSSVVEAGKRL